MSKKRSYPSASASWEQDEGEQDGGNRNELPHLKKKVSSLFSIPTVQEEEDDGSIDSNSLNGPQASIGLDLIMANKNDDAHDTEIKVVFNTANKKNAKKADPSPPPPPLSCTEDSSCGEDEEEEESRNDHHDHAENFSTALSRTGTNDSLPTNNTDEARTMVEEVVISSTSKATANSSSSSSAAAAAAAAASTIDVDTPNNIGNDAGDFKTGVVFEAGSKHFDRHSRFHKERPLRVTSVMDALKKATTTTTNDDDNGTDTTLWNRCCVLGEEEEGKNKNNNSSASAMPSESAKKFLDDDDYLRVHLPGYMKRLDKLFGCNCCTTNNHSNEQRDQKLDREAEQYKSIYFTKDSLTEAKRAASSLCTLVESVVRGELDNGFAVIRPPGHHAEPGLAGGYCIINNVAVAAAYAREKLGKQRILIVDWDVHHGNGTQSIFLQDPNVLYFSAHRWHGGNFFPFLSNGGPTNIGMGDGTGRNINVGWTTKGVGDDEYLALWEVLLLPIAREFQPDLILVSAGFDAARGDLGECDITPEGYARLTRDLMTLNVPIVGALEGGYVRSILGKSVCSVVSALLDRDSATKSKLDYEEDVRYRGGEEKDVLTTINATAAKNIRATMSAHKPYWKCLE